MGSGIFFEQLNDVQVEAVEEMRKKLNTQENTILAEQHLQMNRNSLRIGGVEIPGLGCLESLEQEKAFECRLRNVRGAIKWNDGYLQKANQFRENLLSGGVVALAILPFKAWCLLCKELQLYTFFNITKYGRVTIDIDVNRRADGNAWLREVLAHSQEEIKRALWPKYTNFVDRGWTAPEVSFKINLPKAPDHVVEILKNIHKMIQDGIFEEQDIGVALDNDAFVIENGSRIGQFPNETDPIVFITSNFMVAIVAQYGDFKREKEALEIARRAFIEAFS